MQESKTRLKRRQDVVFSPNILVLDHGGEQYGFLSGAIELFLKNELRSRYTESSTDMVLQSRDTTVTGSRGGKCAKT